jgi:hypothetical protein
MKKSIGALFVLATVVMLSACNGNNAITNPPGTGQSCGGPPNQLEVLYPIPGSKKAPPNLGNIYVSTKGALPSGNSFNFFLSQSNGHSTFTGPFVQINASQIPTPHKNPSYSNPTYYASAIAGPFGSTYVIGPNQAVALFWNDGGTGCTPHTQVASFTTHS